MCALPRALPRAAAQRERPWSTGAPENGDCTCKSSLLVQVTSGTTPYGLHQIGTYRFLALMFLGRRYTQLKFPDLEKQLRNETSSRGSGPYEPKSRTSDYSTYANKWEGSLG